MFLQIFADNIIIIFKLESAQLENAILALRIASISFFIVTLAQALQKIPEALMRYDISNKINLIFVILRFSGMVVVVILGYGIIGLVSILVIIGLLKLIVFYRLSLKLIPGLRIYPSFDKIGIKEVYKAFAKLKQSPLAFNGILNIIQYDEGVQRNPLNESDPNSWETDIYKL